jgi:prolyl-tRNA synthetase
MGSYGIGLERIMACALEQKADDKGAVWPISIAPYDLAMVVLNTDDSAIRAIADEVGAGLGSAGITYLRDDRSASAGVKFNDADLLGIPIKLTIGGKGVRDDRFDITVRESGAVRNAPRDGIVDACRALKDELQGRIDERL